MADRGSDGRVTSTPDIEKVRHYEAMIRKDVAKHMKDGQSWWPAMQEATACARLLQVFFPSPVARSSSHSVTAPGIALSRLPIELQIPNARPIRPSRNRPEVVLPRTRTRRGRSASARTNSSATKPCRILSGIRGPMRLRKLPRVSSRLLMVARARARGAKERRDRVNFRQVPTRRGVLASTPARCARRKRSAEATTRPHRGLRRGCCCPRR